jgi:2,4-diaminopentanoate dehydrogenase
MSERTLRVIVWGVGAIGTEMVTTILDRRSDLDLVGAKVYSEAKDGVDIGELVGRHPIGIAATTNVDRLLALNADCVIYTPRNGDLGEVCQLLASGANVVTTVFLFYPPALAKPDRERLNTACLAGSATLHASGINPGNLSGALPLALSGMSRTIDKVTLQERADMTLYESTDISFGNMGFGDPLELITIENGGFLASMNSMFTEQVWLLADALNAGIEEVVVTVEPVAAKRDHHIFDRVLAAGSTAGQRWNWVGQRAGQPRVEIETLWTVGGEYPEHWPTPEHGWTLTIEGDPSMRTHFLTLASFSRPATIAEHAHAGNVATAMQVLNSVPAVCQAAPGFATAATLPVIRSHTGFLP